MHGGLAESLIFVAFLKHWEKEDKKEQQRLKTRKFYQNLYEQITDESEKTTGLIVDIVTKAATVYIPQELETGVLYFPLFCFGKVLAAQGRITSEQQKLLGFYFDNLKLPFSRSEYIAAATKGSIIGNFQSLMAMTKTELGTFWVDLFRAFYKSGTQDGFQQIVDSVTHNIMRFSLLGNPDSQLSLGICMEFVDCANYQIKNCLDLPVEGVDWLGIVPIKDHIDEMRRIYRGLIRDSDILDTMSDIDALYAFFDMMFLHVICDIVMMTKKPNSVKLEMINYGLELVEVKPIMPPAKYIREIATGTPSGMLYKLQYACEDQPGQFWSMLLVLGDKTGRHDDTMKFLYGLISVLVQVENKFVERYQFLGNDRIVLKYSTHIMTSLLASANAGGK